MKERPSIDTKKIEDIPGKNSYNNYINLRSDILTIEDLENENKIRELLKLREGDYVGEYEETIEKIFKGDTDNNKVRKVLEICSRRGLNIVRARQAKTEDEKAEIFWEIINEIMEDERGAAKTKSLKVAIEQQKAQGIKFEGFEKDNDFSKIHNFLKEIFPNGLLDKALVSRLSYFPETVNITLEESTYYLPINKYLEWKKKFNNLYLYKTRASNRGNLNKSPHILFHSSPIEVYSFIDEDLNNFEYLKEFPDSEKMRLYKLGTVAHEVGHNLFTNLLDQSQKEEWKKIIDSTGHLTYYSEKYSDGIHGNALNYDEEFAEAIRLVSTSSRYLKRKFPKVLNFIINEFPELEASVSIPTT